MIKNLLAFIGFLSIIALAATAFYISSIIKSFDPEAPRMYTEFISNLVRDKNPASAMVWKVPVDEGISAEDVKESMKSLATGNNILFVGESPFYKQAEAVTGKPYRHVAFMSFCDVRVGMLMADYDNAYTALMPCTISLVEDQQGKLWLFSLNMDFLIYGGKTLPPELKQAAIKVKNNLQAVIQGAAKGEF
ncbi:DUF302 domain-containing protein [Candidatus Venteria ishoeyi]|uniref:DUF302 domain-containing protein n=1 Tax=Candidatus Venteria ishoeyi TaxID=1899563 RepID=A0A1H6FF09_9GAMM|nr:DUF302 domain-containing protein [Candidatus Venteria ishoeyi]MDM8545114.1 DUF302 domain-containing protein [Candidatus Venteria ishoeyi]SEH08652.1 Uncharacterised protein [Candidatus Venteria ishoeyi]